MGEKIDYRWYRKNIDQWFFGLDKAVRDALSLYSSQGLPTLNLGNFKRPLVLGSGNAIETGKILFDGTDAVFATESNYEQTLQTYKDLDGAVLISASGEKDAPPIGQALERAGLDRRFLTCNPYATASKFFDKKDVFIFPSLPEPYTYNTSTYLGMILARTREDPKKILRHIDDEVDSILPADLGKRKAFTLLLEKQHNLMLPMLQTKFIELFGRQFGRDVFTRQYAEVHATDVVKTPRELFVSFGYDNEKLGKDRLKVPLPTDCSYGAIMAVGYYFVGKIQAQKKPFFKKNVIDWAKGRGRSPLVKYR
jgi:hypothetical protein